MKFNELIRDKRLAKGLTQLYVAKILGYDSSMPVSLMEAGKMKVPANAIGPICRLLNISTDLIIKGMVMEYEAGLRKTIGKP